MITDLWVQVFGVRSEKGYEKSYIENRAAHPHPKFWVVPPSPGPKRLFLGEKNQFYGQRVIAEAKDARRTGKEKREGGRSFDQPCNPAKSSLNLTGTQEITSKLVSKFSETLY